VWSRQNSEPSLNLTDPQPRASAIGSPRAALVLSLTAAFMVVLDFSIVNVALAAIERELHVDSTDDGRRSRKHERLGLLPTSTDLTNSTRRAQ
jgi:hypothetical protein